MIIKVKINDRLIKTYTDDKTKKIKKIGTNEEYEETIDLISNNYEYIEIDKTQEELDNG